MCGCVTSIHMAVTLWGVLSLTVINSDAFECSASGLCFGSSFRICLCGMSILFLAMARGFLDSLFSLPVDLMFCFICNTSNCISQHMLMEHLWSSWK